MSRVERVTPVEATAIGAAAGVLEVCIMQPTVAVKNAMQQGRPIPWSASGLYRGLLINAASVAPITATQFGANRFFEGVLTNITGTPISQGERVVVALAAGATSALVSCPAELIMIQQQVKGSSLAAETSDLLRTHGVLKLYRGLSVTFAREGLYTAGYLGVCPVLKDYFESNNTFEALPAGVPMLVAGIAGGLFASLGTQWADTIKTRMQTHLDSSQHQQYRNPVSTASYIVQHGGVGALFAGSLPRMIRIVGATFILNWTRNTLTDLVEARKVKEEFVRST